MFGKTYLLRKHIQLKIVFHIARILTYLSTCITNPHQLPSNFSRKVYGRCGEEAMQSLTAYCCTCREQKHVMSTVYAMITKSATVDKFSLYSHKLYLYMVFLSFISNENYTGTWIFMEPWKRSMKVLHVHQSCSECCSIDRTEGVFP